MLRRIFELVPATGSRWCVDFGAWDGKHLSNSWNLLANFNWHGVLIEADVQRHSDLRKTYRDNSRVVALNRKVSFEGSDSLDAILAGTSIPPDFDLLAIDIDGNDYHIWDSVSHFEPKVVLIEFNPSIPNELAFVQDRDLSVNQGSSLLAMVLLGKRKGYELISTTSHNAFFVRKDYYPLFDIANNDIHLMHSPGPYESWIFQLYDSTLVFAGYSKLLWRGNEPITADAIKLAIDQRSASRSDHT